MKGLTPIFLALLVVALLAPANAPADGGFVTVYIPPWDKHKDINEPTQKAIIVYDAGCEDLILQVKYAGPMNEFGWLIPVPNRPTVQNGSMKCFYELSQFTQQQFAFPITAGESLGRNSAAAAARQPPPVKVIETKTVGAYKIAVLSATDSGALKQWLANNHFYLPPDKTRVVDSYVQQRWYFVAVKIRLRENPFKLLSTSFKLASGELNPLQISFASDHCIFPLKISSINGKPSEVQVYVLSPEPLLEKGMLEQKLPEIYSNDMAQFDEHKRLWGDDGAAILFTGPEELLSYSKIAGTALPECSQWISQLAGKSWWLLKQTWTFKPEEMRDLEFQPALSVFAEMLGTRYGRYAAASLTPFGQDAVPTILAAMQSTNPAVRLAASGNFGGGSWGYNSSIRAGSDPRFAKPALAWLKDPQPPVRRKGIELLASGPNLEPEHARAIVEMLADEDAGVRQAAVQCLLSFPIDVKQFNSLFRSMLKDNNPDVQASALQFLCSQQVTLPPDELLSFLKSSDVDAVDTAWLQLQVQGEKLSDNDASALLENRLPTARLLGLEVLAQNPGKQSVENALPLLRDPNELVRLKTVETLQALTGQHFTEDQTDEWIKWWQKNQTHFTAK